MDNNILAVEGIDRHLGTIESLGFQRDAKRNGRKRTVDFNQGIDARFIVRNPELAAALGRIAIDPIRLAFDFLSPAIERDYRKAITLLAEQGFLEFTTYMLYNYNDTPEDFYRRLQINAQLSRELDIRVSGFPMRYIPITGTKRDHVSPKWKWRWLRGIQCVLHATHGLVSPKPSFIAAAFGEDIEDFYRILAMPDRYIVYREHYKHNGADDWWREYRQLSASEQHEFLDLLARLNGNHRRKEIIAGLGRFRSLVEHYYPNGNVPPRSPGEEET
uniref:Uncharacterized protein n=1 Tax=Candidatus Kentrum sp. FW TaxID=2126338 RepID=A0A450RZ49_9GAMM|nr:MAG: hypothetical protein BECKFW1821A_GA0114235_100738 [Candidatus Kentron sp. FW]VFJ54205.1 MAG: hypothetical protein BECKFW1821B_GA0114236_101729 [Candidatus Kentron sp. FW]